MEATAFTGGVETVLSLATQTVEFMIGNPICLVFLAGSLVGIGVGVFKKIKKLAH